MPPIIADTLNLIKLVESNTLSTIIELIKCNCLTPQSIRNFLTGDLDLDILNNNNVPQSVKNRADFVYDEIPDAEISDTYVIRIIIIIIIIYNS